jgi:hypothetical protein
MRRVRSLVAASLFSLSSIGLAQTSPITVGGVVTNTLATPTINSVTTTCAGSTTWTYSVAALDAANGSTAGSTQVSVTTGCTTGGIGPTSYNLIKFTAVSGSVLCNIYRVTPAAGRIANVPCGAGAAQYYLDASTATIDSSSAPTNPSTGSILASGTITAQNFLSSSGTGAGTSDWVAGAPLPLCTQGSPATQPQPCIQAGSFFLQAPSSGSITTSFGWTAPSATNAANGPVIATAGTGTPPASALSVGYLTDTTINPTTQPTLATVTGSLPDGDIVRISNAGAGLIDFEDSGLSATNAGAGTVLGNPTNSSGAPTYTSTPQLGVSGTLGSVTMGNATSGLLTIEPTTGALGTVVASFPANTGTLAELNLAQTFTAAQSFSATGLSVTASGQVQALGYVDTSIGFLTGNMTAQTSTSPQNITGMTWSIAANKNYLLDCEIGVAQSAGATVAFELAGPGSPTSYNLYMDGPLGTAAAYKEIGQLAQTSWGVSTGPDVSTTTTIVIHVKAQIRNGSTSSGTALTLQTVANGTNSITVQANSVCRLTQAN